jgi:predicted dienelactone hydrolase
MRDYVLSFALGNPMAVRATILALLMSACAPALAYPVGERHLTTSEPSAAGGFTALAAAGARVTIRRLWAFCAAHPNDGVCAPQKEFAVTREDAEKLLAQPEIAAEIPPDHADLAIPGVRAAFAMAPAIVQAFDPADLAEVKTPVAIILGEEDPVAPPATNGEIVAADVPGATILKLPSVGHYDFLAECTPAGDAVVPVCPTKAPRGPTHEAAIAAALDLFGRALGPP